MQHGAHRDSDEIAPVVERVDLDAGWQTAVGIELLDRRTQALDHVHRAFELLHQHDAEDDVCLVVAPRDAEARREADLDLRNVRQQDRHAALLGEDDVADVVQRADHPEPAHIDRLLAHRDVAAADIGIARRDRRDDLRQCQPVGHHPVEIDFGLELLGLAAEHRHVGDARHRAQPALDHPILQRL